MFDLDRDVVFILLGGFLLARVLYWAIRARTGSRWSTVEGTIVESETVNFGSSFIPTWRARVRYRYTVGNVAREGDRVGITTVGDGSWRWPAEREMRKYPLGTKVKVYFSPDDPAVALLEPENNITVYGELIIGAVCTGIGIYGLVT